VRFDGLLLQGDGNNSTRIEGGIYENEYVRDGSTATLADIERRIAALNDEDKVRNLQHAYGYYVDRRMWDDVMDLFAKDGVVEIVGVGTFKGAADIRKAMERMGPAGLTEGVLNDHPIFDTLVRVQPGRNEAFSRGLELGQIGAGVGGRQGWEFTVFRNRFVKEGGIWKVGEMRLFPLVKADSGLR
jgi:hypothetical protein